MADKAEILKLYKNLGETPLECLVRFKETHPEYAEIKMTYLGRLDPMAEGLLLVLAGDMKAKKEYLELDKSYEFEVLWGFATDSYDTLGQITETSRMVEKLDFKMPGLIEKILKKKSQSYPVFSSKVFRGNFMAARELKIEEADIPERNIKIFALEHIHTQLITGREILEEVLRRISLVRGDFRQKEIEKSWREVLENQLEETFLISKFKIDVSSGAYVRALAYEMGQLLNNSALAWSIKRTRVGEYLI